MPTSLFLLRLTLALIGAVGVLALSACGDDEPAGPEPGTGGGDVVVLLPNSASTERWERDDRPLLARELEAAGIEHSIVNAEGDARQMQTQAEQAIAGGAKVLMMVNLDAESGNTIIANARQNEVAVIDYDRLTVGGDGADYYVSFDGETVGRLLGRGLVEAVTAAGLIAPDVAILSGPPTDNNAELFAAGYNAVIDPLFADGEWTKLEEQPVPEWDAREAALVFEQIYTEADGNVDAVLAANDQLAGAVVDTLEDRGVAPIPLTGQDATVAGLQNVLAGRQSMTVYKAIAEQAAAAVRLAVAVLEGEPTDALAPDRMDNGTRQIPSVLLDPVAVTQENIAETVIADGFRTWAEICIEDIDAFCPPADER